MAVRLRIFLLTCRDLLGYCDPPFWPTFKYDDDSRLRWMIDG